MIEALKQLAATMLRKAADRFDPVKAQVAAECPLAEFELVEPRLQQEPPRATSEPKRGSLAWRMAQARRRLH